jgi:hypothetical protein
MPHDCLITPRLAGPCARCRQAAWPAHVRGLLIYCEACCGCGHGGAQAAGADAAPRRAAAGPAREAGPGAADAAAALTTMPPWLCCRRRPGRPAHRTPLGARYRRRYCAGTGRESPRYRPARGERFWGRFCPCAGHCARRSARRCPGLRASARPGRCARDLLSARPQHAARPKGPVRLPPPALGRPRRARPNTQVCAAQSAAKRFHARMFRAKSHVEGEQ